MGHWALVVAAQPWYFGPSVGHIGWLVKLLPGNSRGERSGSCVAAIVLFFLFWVECGSYRLVGWGKVLPGSRRRGRSGSGVAAATFSATGRLPATHPALLAQLHWVNQTLPTFHMWLDLLRLFPFLLFFLTISH